eukprot:TRINITY_DN8821_c0_g1_i1.p1 TRINITY_DN8821_c0_g1~~TRINITY_DN8821_c0_g1_i1.p1  ORF type:complete len:143 (-),score=10.75 TRINITY_DN8821_c0_g1_i1:37-465(-)
MKLADVLSISKFFQSIQENFSESSLECLLQHIEYKFVPARQAVFYCGEPGKEFYFILKGKVSVWIPPKGFSMPKHNRRGSVSDSIPTDGDQIASHQNQGFIKVREMVDGDSFGEIALTTNSMRTASIVTVEDSHFALSLIHI